MARGKKAGLGPMLAKLENQVVKSQKLAVKAAGELVGRDASEVKILIEWASTLGTLVTVLQGMQLRLSGGGEG